MLTWLALQAMIRPAPHYASDLERVNRVNPARGDISDISLLTKYSSVKPVNPARGVKSAISPPQISITSQFC